MSVHKAPGARATRVSQEWKAEQRDHNMVWTDHAAAGLLTGNHDVRS